MAICFKTKLTNNSNVNDSTSWTSRGVFNTSPLINEGGISVSNNSIDVPETGIYLCCFSCYFVTTDSRENVGVRWSVNGTLQGEISASDYMRVSPQEEATTDLQTIYSLNADDSLDLQFAQLADTASVTLEGDFSFVSLVKLD